MKRHVARPRGVTQADRAHTAPQGKPGQTQVLLPVCHAGCLFPRWEPSQDHQQRRWSWPFEGWQEERDPFSKAAAALWVLRKWHLILGQGLLPALSPPPSSMPPLQRRLPGPDFCPVKAPGTDCHPLPTPPGTPTGPGFTCGSILFLYLRAGLISLPPTQH